MNDSINNSAPDPELLARASELCRIGNRAVHNAQNESRRMGVPNVYEINGIIYYELPSGELSREDPYIDQQDK